ncbi:xanthine dehydrogenase [Sphingobium lactosutens]|uniref:XdhC family protein n=1 Tax=Sphingobium lactosutens TaxID=522773 RepID=UPI0015BB6808|nr:XdhC family protein [Sphingobium lactosutens]NWK98413.1 xanthine dehydrogenase [Sphingobium lactosutens]
MNSLTSTPTNILQFTLERPTRGRDIVLVTLVGITGSSPRALGAQMAVDAFGDYRGSFSGGCIEAAVVAEAVATLQSGKARLVRFGVGSPYIDIRLPCGGGIDLLFSPRPDPQIIAAILTELEGRRPTGINVSLDGIGVAIVPDVATGWHSNTFSVAYLPCVRIVAMGHGDTLISTARLAHFLGADVQAFSPLRSDVSTLLANQIDSTLLEIRTQTPTLESDPWTAFAFLFHEHEWEDTLLPWALRQAHFCALAIGGHGSRKNRSEMLRREGFARAVLERFELPAGLIPATRDPATLALSIVSQIIGEYHSSVLGGGAAHDTNRLTQSLAP